MFKQYSQAVHTLQLYDPRYKSHFADGEEPVMPQRWAIIIVAVTTLKSPWVSSRVSSFGFQARFWWAIHGNQLLALMSDLGGCRARGMCVLLEWGPK